MAEANQEASVRRASSTSAGPSLISRSPLPANDVSRFPPPNRRTTRQCRESSPSSRSSSSGHGGSGPAGTSNSSTPRPINPASSCSSTASSTRRDDRGSLLPDQGRPAHGAHQGQEVAQRVLSHVLEAVLGVQLPEHQPPGMALHQVPQVGSRLGEDRILLQDLESAAHCVQDGRPAHLPSTGQFRWFQQGQAEVTCQDEPVLLRKQRSRVRKQT